MDDEILVLVPVKTKKSNLKFCKGGLLVLTAIVIK